MESSEAIFSALMTLMKTQPYEKISVTEITAKAGVSRMAYYRNYTSKEDIFIKHLDKIFTSYLSDIMNSNDDDLDSVYVGFFSYFRKQADFIGELINAGLSYLILDKFYKYLIMIKENVFYHISSSDINDYQLYFAAGGLYEVLIEWVKKGCLESDEQMAKIIRSLSGYIKTDNN
jgi:AcrR family transcriptional regulator